MNIPRHVIVPSFTFCLYQLTALTHHMGHRFSLTSAHSAQNGILLCDQLKSHIICSQSLFLGATYQGLSHILSNLLLQSTAKFYSSQYLPFLSHAVHTFFSASIHSPSPLLHSIHFGSTASEMLTTLLSPTSLYSVLEGKFASP